ncbi:hypothetical protein SAMN03080615_02478 [Amphritea atlantica]|jgi:glycosyltransferase A (GT-A) superfamily protein (DUF2064 family)|uniref:DUF2064 domain-containing protein n=1 Tax=Amphritea atlantica TaxID=355243 RepID=A0A1H9I7H6_9GAMM|nr:DUF2064 domain-containing protein [Amphritea atlantica]SEQ70529.1 hypothetical protein SAMN03080615_02478 [Amphritea atlantica]
MSQQPTLVIFCKRPLHGQGKQRIAATLGKDAAYQVACALLNCALEDARSWPGPVVLSPGSEADRQWAEDLLLRECQVVPQCEGNLGAKLNYVDRIVRQQGIEQLLFIGTDAPEHNAQHYAELCQLQQQSDIVLSPAEDGGVTAMGGRTPWPVLENLPWSTPQLGAQLACVCEAADFQVAFSSTGYDVDTEADLRRLLGTLAYDSRPARQQLLQLLQVLLKER